MKSPRLDAGTIRTALILLLAAALSGCGAGGDSMAGGGIGGSGITVSSVSVGTVSGFGSIMVNDVAYDTSSAEVVVDGVPVGRGDSAVRGHLSVGMVVRIEGSRGEDGTGQAARVVYNDTVDGPIERITPLDPLVTELVILGQTVRIDERTELRDAAPADLKGIVRNVDPDAKTFRINDLTVHYQRAALSGFTALHPEVGRLAEVAGQWVAVNVLEAARVDFENELGLDEAASAEIEGFVTEVVEPGRFTVATADIATDSATVFTDIAAGEVAVGKRVRVLGALSRRVVLADEVRPGERVVLESDVSDVDLSRGLLTLTGLEPIVVHTDASTRYAGFSGLSELAGGVHVKIFGRVSGTARVTAGLILVIPVGKKVVLTGPADALTPPDFIQILGVTIDTAAIPEGGFVSKDGRPVSAAHFFESIREGDILSAGGTLSGETVKWSRIEHR
ncbi:MAG: DUF5666 domain-containing protein [Desulfobacterales bacterium]|nr:DUF5666 domain-containing protein [Desulfobacterales bacterium]